LLAEIGTKKEKISATKKLVVLSQGDVEDRPADARKLLGLGSGAVQLAASGCGGRDVFVQSTSGNRGLLAGSRMLFEVPFSPAGKKRKAVATSVAGSQDPDRKRLEEEDPDRAGRPPLVVEWMDRVDVAVPAAFPGLRHDRLMVAFIKQVGVHQIREMFEKHAAGECQCIEATVEHLAACEWYRGVDPPPSHRRAPTIPPRMMPLLPTLRPCARLVQFTT